MDGDETIYLNGTFVPRREGGLDVLDRGTLFGDGVYEVVRYVNGRGFAMGRHLARLGRSLDAIELPCPTTLAEIGARGDELVRQRGLSDAKLYIQVTRGPATRNHVMPDTPSPSVLMLADPAPGLPGADAPPAALSLMTVEDNRWGDCWVKSLMLLPNSLAKTRAVRAGCDDALFVRDLDTQGDAGIVTEATAANAMAVIDGAVWTHPADRRILGGVTRDIVLELARELGIAVHETPMTLSRFGAADEALLCGTTMLVSAVTRCDGRPLGSGGRGGSGPTGPITQALSRALAARMQRDCPRA